MTNSKASGRRKPGQTAEGTWLYTIDTEYGVMDGSFELKQSGQDLTGDFVNMGTSSVIFDGHVDGKQVSFDSTLRTRMSVMMLRVEATIDANLMQGMLLTPLGDSPFTARRAKEPNRQRIKNG